MNFRHLLYFIVFLPAITWSQDTSVELSLKESLSALQDRYAIEFSYVDEVIIGKTVQYDSTLTLNESLQKFELQTRLRFERVEDSYFLVRNYRDNDLVSLCGIIANAGGEKLLGVSIGFTESAGVFTDEQGHFKLDSIPFGSWLTLRYVGYFTKKLKVSRLNFQECIQILMSESVEELAEIVVSDYLAAGISKNKNQIRIDPHTLKTLAGLAEPDIMTSVQQIPGVNSPFETAAGIHVRGGLPDQNLVLWNGIKTYNQGHFFGMISAFNPYIADKVTFIKHGTPAEYGDRISSVIDITTNTDVSETISGGVGANMLFADGFIEMPIIEDKWSIQFSGRRSFTDVVNTPTYQKLSDRVFQNTKIGDATSAAQQTRNDFYFTDVAFNSTLQVDSRNKLILSGLYNRNQLNFESQDTNANQSFNDNLTNANEGLGIHWNSNLNRKWKIDSRGSLSRYILRYDFTESVSDTVTQSSKKNFVQEWALQFNGTYLISELSRLKAGYHMSNSRIRYAYETQSPNYSIILDDDNSQVTTHAGFLDFVYDNNNLIIQPGVRFNYYSQLNEYFFEPRLYFQRSISESFSASISGEYRTQIASQIKESVVSDLSLENKVWSLASPDRFPVLTSYQITAGLEYESNGWFAESEAYFKEFDGVTTLIFGYLNGLENQFREGDSRIRGVDVLLKKTWLNYETWLSYAYLRTDNTFDGINNNESFPGSWSIEHTVRLSNLIQLNNWELSLGWMWHTGKTYTDVFVEDAAVSGPVQILYDAINANNLPDYHRLDFSAMREFRSKNHPNIRYRAGLSILNLYNRRNLLNREFRTTPSLENELIDTRVYSLGITPNLVFRFFW